MSILENYMIIYTIYIQFTYFPRYLNSLILTIQTVFKMIYKTVKSTTTTNSGLGLNNNNSKHRTGFWFYTNP